jgi:hypothetical protein
MRGGKSRDPSAVPTFIPVAALFFIHTPGEWTNIHPHAHFFYMYVHKYIRRSARGGEAKEMTAFRPRGGTQCTKVSDIGRRSRRRVLFSHVENTYTRSTERERVGEQGVAGVRRHTFFRTFAIRIPAPPPPPKCIHIHV